MGHDVRAQDADGGGRQVVRVYRHTAGEDQKVRALMQEFLCLRGDHVQIVVADGHAQNLSGILLHFRPDHRLKFVLDAAGIDLGAGNDDTQLLLLIGPQIQQLLLRAELLCPENLLLLGDEGHDAHGCQPCTGLHGVVVRQRGDGDVADGVDALQKRRVHTEHTAFIGHQEHLALGGGGVVGTLHGSHGGHAQGRVLLMDLPCIILPHENRALSQIQQGGNILLGDHMAPLVGRALKAVAHGGNVMAQGHTDSVFHSDFFHIINPFSRVPAGSGPLPAGTTAITLLPIILLTTTLP